MIINNFAGGSYELYRHKPLEFHSITCKDGVANAIVFSFSSDCEKLYSASGKVIRFGETEKNLLSRIISEGKCAFITPLNDVYSEKLEMKKDCPFGACQQVKNLMELLLIQAVRCCDYNTPILQNAVDSSRIKDICIYIEEHIRKPLKFEDICKEFSVAKAFKLEPALKGGF